MTTAPSDALPLGPRTAYTYAAALRRIIDADTLDVGVDLGFRVTLDQRIRLLGVDAPERNTPAGKTANAWVADWFLDHVRTNTVLLHTRKPADHDKYGRYLAYVLAPDGACLNRDLLNARLATPYPA